MTAPTLYDWQCDSANRLYESLVSHGIAADGSDTGTGKTYKVCSVARSRQRPLVVLCPKSIVPEWERVAGLFGVTCQAINYEKVRTGKTPFGRWQVKGKVFEWTVPAGTLLVFDEAHRCGGLQTQNSALLIAAKRQGISCVLLSATLIGSPLKAYAIGYALGLHRLTNFWQWARQNGVTDGFFGPEWKPDDPEAIMQAIRVSLGDKFTRIRKADVPNFPQCQLIPTFVQTDEMPDLESDYSTEARRTVELLKVPGLIEKTRELVDDEGMSVAIFVNFRATLAKLYEAFPKAVLVYGGQTATERTTVLNSFQQNEAHVILLMAQAGGTGVSLHDLHGRPRAALICPGYDAVEFLQVLGRIHRAGSLSPAINFVIFASGVPVERRIRARLEAKLTNMTALNDYDLGQYDSQPGSAASGGVAEDPIPAHADQPGIGEARGDRLARKPHPDPDAVHQVQHGLNVTLMSKKITPLPTDIPVDATVVNSDQAATTPVAHVERKHARCSPSKLKNLEICPSYEGDNDGPVHPVTLRGTAMHEALEKSDDAKLDPASTEGVIPGKTVEHELVAMCREFQNGEAVPGEVVILEPHLKTHDRDVQGFADRVVLEPTYTYRVTNTTAGLGTPSSVEKIGRKARIRDYKFGFNLVDLPNINPQAIAYTVALFLENPEIEEINFAFLIPRLDTVLEHTFYRGELPELKLRISTIAERVRKLAGKEFNPNFENCLYCGRKATCTTMHAKMLPLAAGIPAEDRLPLPAVLDPTAITEPQHLAWLLNLASIAESFASQAKGFALRYRLELGQEIPGYDLIERKGKREVTDTNAAFAVAKEFGVTEPEFLGAARMSVTALDTAVREHAAAGDKDKAAGRFTDRLADENAITRGSSFHVLQKSRKKKAPALAA